MTRRHVPGGPVVLALATAAFMTVGMTVAWVVASHDYDDPRLLGDVWPVLVVLVATLLVVVRLTGIDVQGGLRVHWVGWIAAGGVAIGVVGLVVALAQGGADRPVVVTVMLATILVGVGEEVAYRGIVLNALGERMTVPWAVVCSAGLFGLLHAPNVIVQSVGATAFQLVFTTLFGILLGWVYVLSGRNLVLVIVLHWLWDAQLIVPHATDADGNPLGSLPAFVMVVALVAGSVVAYRRLRGTTLAQLAGR